MGACLAVFASMPRPAAFAFLVLLGLSRRKLVHLPSGCGPDQICAVRCHGEGTRDRGRCPLVRAARPVRDAIPASWPPAGVTRATCAPRVPCRRRTCSRASLWVWHRKDSFRYGVTPIENVFPSSEILSESGDWRDGWGFQRGLRRRSAPGLPALVAVGPGGSAGRWSTGVRTAAA